MPFWFSSRFLWTQSPIEPGFEPYDKLLRAERQVSRCRFANGFQFAGEICGCQPLRPIPDTPDEGQTRVEQGIRRSMRMSSCTRPSVVFCTLDHPRAHRVSFHISDCRPQMRFIEDARIEATLP